MGDPDRAPGFSIPWRSVLITSGVGLLTTVAIDFYLLSTSASYDSTGHGAMGRDLMWFGVYALLPLQILLGMMMAGAAFVLTRPDPDADPWE